MFDPTTTIEPGAGTVYTQYDVATGTVRIRINTDEPILLELPVEIARTLVPVLTRTLARYPDVSDEVIWNFKGGPPPRAAGPSDPPPYDKRR